MPGQACRQRWLGCRLVEHEFEFRVVHGVPFDKYVHSVHDRWHPFCPRVPKNRSGDINPRHRYREVLPWTRSRFAG